MSTEITTLEARLAAQLEKQAATTQSMRSSGSYISFKNAQLKVDGQPVPNNTADVRVLAAISERAYYPGAYDADKAQVPACYALDSLEPHPQVADPQSSDCTSCEHNKWGSALDARGNPGKGKACREGARVIVVPANVPLKSAPLYTAKIPVTSLSAIQNFSSRCQQAQKLSGEFVTTLSCTEDKKSFFKVHLTMKEITNDLDMGLLLDRQDEAMQLALQPYPNIEA